MKIDATIKVLNRLADLRPIPAPKFSHLRSDPSTNVIAHRSV